MAATPANQTGQQRLLAQYWPFPGFWKGSRMASGYQILRRCPAAPGKVTMDLFFPAGEPWPKIPTGSDETQRSCLKPAASVTRDKKNETNLAPD